MAPKIKICGLRTKEDAAILNENQVDFAGFVLFFEKSKRCVEIEQAVQIMKYLSGTIRTVAVTVSPTVGQLHQIEAAGFDFLQVHGDLLPQVLEEADLPILRAVNITGKVLSSKQDLQALEISDKIAGYVLDGKNPGGGKNFDWGRMKPAIQNVFSGKRSDKLFMLAGGLYPENVEQAVRLLSPDIVDVSSGVELPGLDKDGKAYGKDREKVRLFCQNAQVEQSSVSYAGNKAI